MRDTGRMDPDELQEAVADAAESLFGTPRPEAKAPVTDEDVREAAYRLFGQTPPRARQGGDR